ncbi:sugar phosphate isomerase/epimerase family protein [Bosea sp. NBC_00550]|uniref:sugar phosphate isomerase/epimerase family protein n=1 Tax=Bosea sp. NBC_00550 TaxID=2969621 RepID=UPI0022311AE2|nr:sugar phosphate isomerase/epimerase family protein [Bosea sp. NBC_00550]UZF95409.1 sugar phosphate isomerase/epimerase [Bosea sp. NBC_00550]
MRTIKGPGLFIAQFIDANEQLSTLDGMCAWAAGLGFRGLQVPTWQSHMFDLARAAESQTYCDEFLGTLAKHGLELTELTCQRHGHLLAVHPAYDATVDGFAPAAVRNKPEARAEWAKNQLLLAAKAARRLGVDRIVSFSGSLLWPYFYPYPPAPEGLLDAGFRELARRWRPILDAYGADGIELCFELHPSEDLHDGATFERFLALLGGHPRCNLLYDPSHFLLQHMDYLGFIEIYHERIKAFHVKDAEFRMSARSGVYGGYQDWARRPGRFRSPGDGQIDFRSIFSLLTAHDYDGWACLEWECYLKERYRGAAEGAAFIADHIIPVTEAAFDAPMRPAVDEARIDAVLGLRKPPR